MKSIWIVLLALSLTLGIAMLGWTSFKTEPDTATGDVHALPFPDQSNQPLVQHASDTGIQANA